MHVIGSSAVRLIALALIAALVVIEHLRLANWVRLHAGGARRAVLALFLPGAGAFLAWRGGERARAVVYVSLIMAYVLIRVLP